MVNDCFLHILILKSSTAAIHSDLFKYSFTCKQFTLCVAITYWLFCYTVNSFVNESNKNLCFIKTTLSKTEISPVLMHVNMQVCISHQITGHCMNCIIWRWQVLEVHDNLPAGSLTEQLVWHITGCVPLHKHTHRNNFVLYMVNVHRTLFCCHSPPPEFHNTRLQFLFCSLGFPGNTSLTRSKPSLLG